MSLDKNRPVMTRNGDPVKILTWTDGPRNFPIVGIINKKDGTQTISQWIASGKIVPTETFSWDLVNVPEVKKVPLEPSDIKPGDVVRRNNNWNNKALWNVVLGVNYSHYAKKYYLILNYGPLFFDNLDEWEISHDGGKTWQETTKTITQ